MGVLENIVNQIEGARKKVAHAVSGAKFAEGKIAEAHREKKKARQGSPAWTKAGRKANYWEAVLKRSLQAEHLWQGALNRRVKKKVAYLKAHPPVPSANKAGFTMVDGRQVPNWIASELAKARQSGRWKGTVVSGFRTPAYSTSLCEHMCGAPSCPGRCAGAASNHACPPTATGKPYEGAVDVTDYAGLRAWCESHGSPLKGGGRYLPSDPVHFSYTGR